MSDLDRLLKLSGMNAQTQTQETDNREFKEAVGEFAKPIYDLIDELGVDDNHPVLDELIRYMSGDQIKDFVADYRRHHEMNDVNVIDDDDPRYANDENLPKDESIEPTEPSKEEGNKFSGELADAKKDGKKEFEVDGKKYKVEASAFVEDEIEEDAFDKEDRITDPQELNIYNDEDLKAAKAMSAEDLKDELEGDIYHLMDKASDDFTDNDHIADEMGDNFASMHLNADDATLSCYSAIRDLIDADPADVYETGKKCLKILGAQEHQDQEQGNKGPKGRPAADAYAGAMESELNEATGKCEDCGCVIDDPKPGCDCPHDVHDASQDNWVKEANRLKELSGIISEAPVSLQNKRGWTPGAPDTPDARLQNRRGWTPGEQEPDARLQNKRGWTPGETEPGYEPGNRGFTPGVQVPPMEPASAVIDPNDIEPIDPASDNNPNLDKYQDDEYNDMVRRDDEQTTKAFNFRELLKKLYRTSGSNPATEFSDSVEEEAPVQEDNKSIKVDKLIPIAGDSIWDKEGENPKQIKVDSISITNPYEAGSYMDDEEDDGYRQVNVEHDGPWSIYTDSGFEKAISELVGFEVDFTEQGMQEDGMASMEGMMDDKIKSEAFANYKPNRFKDMPKGMNEAPTMDTTQLITLLKNSGLTEAEIKQRVDEWANTPEVGASEDKETSHGEPYENFAQSVNLSLKKYLDAEDFKVGLKEHKVDEIKEAYKKSKKAKKDKK